jgi:predicted AlkP superfamily pyrophosphatase or phosphodiesterase
MIPFFCHSERSEESSWVHACGRRAGFFAALRMTGLAGLFVFAGLLSAVAAAPLAKHVVVIGLDGCRPELLLEHSSGALKKFWQEGAFTWSAEAAVPSVTQVNFASILTGCTPTKHGINQVAWDHETSPKLKVKVTTIFEVLAQHKRSGAAFLGHEKLYPVETAAAAEAGIHFVHSPHGTKAAAPLAARHLREHQPAFTFVYFGDLDGAGHRDGWLSPQQIATMAEINRGVDLVFAAIEETAMKDNTVVIVTSDHGGLGKSHSQGRPEDRKIPWVIWGRGVKSAAEICECEAERILNQDTAPTALHVLGIDFPREWDGRVVLEAFESVK